MTAQGLTSILVPECVNVHVLWQNFDINAAAVHESCSDLGRCTEWMMRVTSSQQFTSNLTYAMMKLKQHVSQVVVISKVQLWNRWIATLLTELYEFLHFLQFFCLEGSLHSKLANGIKISILIFWANSVLFISGLQIMTLFLCLFLCLMFSIVASKFEFKRARTYMSLLWKKYCKDGLMTEQDFRKVSQCQWLSVCSGKCYVPK